MYLNNLQQDEVFVPSEIKPFESITGIQSRRGLENVIVSNGKIVNVVSKSYGHIPNELFFSKAEQLLVEAKLNYRKRTINRNDRSFVVDFIIDNGNLFELKNKEDHILPMLRFKNSYDGSEKTSGHFGFYRQVCTNGLHVSQAKIAFSIRHTRNCTDLILPNLNQLFEQFLDNEYYGVTQKFKEMEAIEIIDTKTFVKDILDKTKLFRFECSDNNDNPSKKSRELIQLIEEETFPVTSKPNLWTGYNAFNWMLHNALKKGFAQQERLDKVVFDEIYDLV